MASRDESAAEVGPDDRWPDDFAAVARALHAESSVQRTLEVMCRLAVHVIDGAEHAGITVVRAGRFETPAASDDIPPVVDRIQYDTGQGPCVDAIRTHETLRFNDLSGERRWPDFISRITAETDVRSMLSYRLFVEDDTLGALNLYSSRANAFATDNQPLGDIFAAHAALALRAAMEHDHVANLELALTTNRRIGIAIGILMSRGVVSEDRALGQLIHASQSENRKLRDIADGVIDAGELTPGGFGYDNGRP